MSSAHKDLDRALAEHAARTAETTAARDVEAKAQAAFYKDGSDKRRNTLMRERLTRERFEHLEAEAQVVVDAARTAAKCEDEATARTRFDAASARVTKWRQTILPEVEAIVALDRQLTAIVDSIADKVLVGRDAFIEAGAIAESLHTDYRGAKPTIKQARLLAQSAIDRARKQDGRDPIHGWTDSADTDIDWRDDASRVEHELALAALGQGDV